MIIDEDLKKLLCVFPKYITTSLNKHPFQKELLEVVMDLGRRPEGRFFNKTEFLSQQKVSKEDLKEIVKSLGKFNKDNRAGIEQSLHRISCIRNRDKKIIGITCRIGRCLVGSIYVIRDLLETNQSLLILGKPGTGKTTLIREISRVLSDEKGKRVIVVDSSSEIGGESDIPHKGIGKARRMFVSRFEDQHSVMIEAVENHTPEVIIVDEIGSELEVFAARSIAERGVQLIGTAHGQSLANLLKNPVLLDLLGGIQSVTLSDEEAKRRKTQKTILERKTFPSFQIAIELTSRNSWIIHENIMNSVDTLLRGQEPSTQLRRLEENNVLQIKALNYAPLEDLKEEASQILKKPLSKKKLREKMEKQKREDESFSSFLLSLNRPSKSINEKEEVSFLIPKEEKLKSIKSKTKQVKNEKLNKEKNPKEKTSKERVIKKQESTKEVLQEKLPTKQENKEKVVKKQIKTKKVKIQEEKVLIINTLSLSKENINKAFQALGLQTVFTKSLDKVDLILRHKKDSKKTNLLQKKAEKKEIPFAFLKNDNLQNLVHYFKILSKKKKLN